MKKVIVLLGTGFYAGFSPLAPGTVGSIIGVLFYLTIHKLNSLVYLIIISGLFGLGIWISGKCEIILGQKDSPRIVIDEIVGFLVVMLFLPAKVLYIIAGFFLFRITDIWKPYPINVLDRRIKGGLGIMLDDLVAAVYANLILQGVRVFLA